VNECPLCFSTATETGCTNATCGWIRPSVEPRPTTPPQDDRTARRLRRRRRRRQPTEPTSPDLAGARTRLLEGLACGITCECCGAFAKRYNRKLNSGMARWLVALVRLSPHGEWVEASAVTENIGSRIGQDATTLLPSWNLIESCPVCLRASGRWRPTQLGRDFVAGRATVPRSIYAYNKTCLGLDITKGFITVRDALGSKFNYEELMRDV